MEIIFYLSIDELKGDGFPNWVASFGFNHGENFIVKHAQARVVLGWVTFWEVSMLHPYENHLDLISAKHSTFSHEIWIHVESLLMKHGSMSLTQNHIVKS